MMTKYQLVFLRLETGMIKMLRSYNARQMPTMRRMFMRWKRTRWSGGDTQLREIKLKQTALKFTRLLSKRMPMAVKRNGRAVVGKAWRRWASEWEGERQKRSQIIEERELALKEKEN